MLNKHIFGLLAVESQVWQAAFAIRDAKVSAQNISYIRRARSFRRIYGWWADT